MTLRVLKKGDWVEHGRCGHCGSLDIEVEKTIKYVDFYIKDYHGTDYVTSEMIFGKCFDCEGEILYLTKLLKHSRVWDGFWLQF
ncbi:MAG: hypothetical protein ACTSQA_01230 [Candidatus Heimdallarchaeaceae archaeon]